MTAGDVEIAKLPAVIDRRYSKKQSPWTTRLITRIGHGFL
jgi:hypothetical protein